MTRLPRQIINLIGALVVIAVLAAGVLVGVVPLYMESARIASDADRAVSDNSVFQAQLDSLTQQSRQFDELKDDVDALRAQIPSTPTLDDVFAIIADAAAESNVTVLSIQTGDPIAWTPQTAPLDTESMDALAAEAAAEPAPASEDASASTETDATGGSADAATAESGDAAASADTEVEAAGPQQSVAFSITVASGRPVDMFQFIDELGSGPRLLSIVHTSMEGAREDSTLTVNALTFIRTES